MVDLPQKKVGIVACSGEEMAEGTVTRYAALKVLEELRPADTVTICLPLFLAGGEGDRAFARFYPTIAVDGCEERCAARATELYSGKPAASLLISDLIAENGMERPQSYRQLDKAGAQAVTITAERMAEMVDELLGQRWSRRAGEVVETEIEVKPQQTQQATCECGSGIPVQELVIEGQKVTLVALPLIFEKFQESGKPPTDGTARELLDTVKIYNLIPAGAEEAYATTLLREYAAYCEENQKERVR